MDETVARAVLRHEKAKRSVAEAAKDLKGELKSAVKEKRITDKEAQDIQRALAKE